jgi:D-glycero-D-manno-heptose 1,7-bisphosphate phosphatase
VVMNKALFLDRDGVINLDTGYLSQPEDFYFMDGIFDLCRRFIEAGYLIIVITNQSGVARGYFTEEEYQRLNQHMLRGFAEQGIAITQVYACFYHPEGKGRYRGNSPNRKPNPGFFIQAREQYSIDMQTSLMIGDKPSDIEASAAAGVPHRFLLRGRYTLEEEMPSCVVVEHLREVLDHFTFV